jgi:predicted TIM-barrel fold metal-dependent hydrolase
MGLPLNMKALPSAVFFLVAILGAIAIAQERPEPLGDAIGDLPLFDAHIHYKEPAWVPYPVERVIELMDENGVAMGLVSSTPDDGTIMLWEHAPERIVPELRPYHGDAGSSNWTAFEDIDAYLEERLEQYPHEGIGEFHIRSEAMWNEPLMRKVIAMAKERNIPLHIHSGTEPIRWVYGVDPEVKIIWAHAGLGESASDVYALMAEFPNLYADTSLREYEILGFESELDPEWEKIIFDFQDRLMIGSDTWANSQWDRYSDIMDINRQWLSLLPREVAEKIAYKNAEKLFGRNVSMDLVGTN